jgi:tetratricopeptide (TPR) repeat protein
MNLMGASATGAAGFYGANFGPVPFAIGRPPHQDYFVLKVFSQVQFDAQPANPREVQAGDVPDFHKTHYSAENRVMFPWKPEALEIAKLASQLEEDGRVAEAIQHYREALTVDPDNPVILNNLARILATADKPELCNGEEAVQLATKAVVLTNARHVVFFETLAAAHARAGQFSEAIKVTSITRYLALLTDQQTEADRNAQLWAFYSSGHALDAAQADFLKIEMSPAR